MPAGASNLKKRAHVGELELGGSGRDSYAFLSTRPLHILAFLLPLVLAYEIGSAVYLSGPQGASVPDVRAEGMLRAVFDALGAGGLYLPGILLVVVLLIWHVLTKDRWRVRPSVCAWMTVESALWTLPLLVLGQMLYRLMQVPPELAATTAGTLDPTTALLQQQPGTARALVSIGAGLYEELLFRLVGIAVIHAIAADLLRVPEGPARATAVFVTAVLFALYHNVMLPTGGIDPVRLAHFTAAGIYFGTLYIMRGFGIVVAVHALYDVVVLVLLRH